VLRVVFGDGHVEKVRHEFWCGAVPEQMGVGGIYQDPSFDTAQGGAPAMRHIDVVVECSGRA
jgi:hypothetical protein